MNLIISFSARKDGNCDSIASFVSSASDKTVYMREQNIHPCANCDYECFHAQCKYREDDVYDLYANMLRYDKVVLIVPMYCGNPCSLYFSFHERCQDYFMHNDTYDEIIKRLYIIGVFGSEKDTPDFIPCFEKWFACSPYQGHVLGIQRHVYGQKMADSILDIAEVRERIREFLNT